MDTLSLLLSTKELTILSLGALGVKRFPSLDQRMVESFPMHLHLIVTSSPTFTFDRVGNISGVGATS